MTLPTIRTRLRIELDDQDAANQTWTDTELNRFIDHALRDLSHAIPQQQKSIVATTSGSRNIAVSALSPRLRIVAVEYKIDQDPRQFRDFSLWQDTLTILGHPIPDGSNAAIYWENPHTITESSSTLSTADEDILLLGAAGYACRQQSAFTTNRITIGGATTDRDWKALATEYLREFRAALRRRQAKLRQRFLYTPETPIPTQSTDPGP